MTKGSSPYYIFVDFVLKYKQLYYNSCDNRSTMRAYICIFLIAAMTARSPKATSRKIATGSHRLPNFQNSTVQT